MFLSDFASIRGLKSNTVAAYVNNHPEISEHTTMDGKQKVLDDIAVELLDKKYPLPKPIQIIEDTESRNKLLEAQRTIIKMQQVIIEVSAEKERLAIQAERVMLLETAEKEKADKISKLEADIERQDELLDRREQELSAVKQELSRLKNRSFWERILNR